MVDVTRVPEGAFGYVPTPALVAPIEFTMRAVDDYAALGGHAPMDHVRGRAGQGGEGLNPTANVARANPVAARARHRGRRTGMIARPPQARLLPDGRRLHLQPRAD